MKQAVTMATLVLLVNFKTVPASAQPDVSKFEIGLSAGVFVYQGDLTPYRLGSYNTLRPVIALSINRIINNKFSLRTNLAFGGLRGDDGKYPTPAYRQQRNFNFRSPVFEISELFMATILGTNGTGQHMGVSAYVFGGPGITLLNIRRDWSRFNPEYFSSESITIAGLVSDQQHALPRLIPVVPLGIGARFPVSSRLSLAVETSYRFTFTDYLDGFSKGANDLRKDSYQSHTIGLIYHFKKNIALKCPVF